MEREYLLNGDRLVTGTLRFADALKGTTTVHGASVEAHRQFFAAQSGEYFPIRGATGQFSFDALYDIPLRYELPTKGIAWNLDEVVEAILRDEPLRARVERETATPENRKTLDEDLVLHTAAHMLYKAVAAIGGVNEQAIEYGYKIDRREVAVWERQEGGVGLSETFIDALLSDPVDVYKEMLASVLCPVNLAESRDWTSSDDLCTQLSDRWSLPASDWFLDNLVREAQAERRVHEHQSEETHLVCSPPEGHDGCPACVRATYCTRRDEQTIAVSRLVGEAILAALVRRLDRDEVEAKINDHIAQGVTPPSILAAKPSEGIYDLLLL